tara:strand:- start:416 stop:1147 length:732 start_codon:yes stop_codon:yes gene_type:complete
MSKLYNLGCSFAYGNCVPEKNKLCDTHISPGTLIAKHLGYEEVNLACNGNSLDGVLRRLYTWPFEKDGIILIGIPPAGRFQVVHQRQQHTTKERNSKSKLFGRNTEAEECIKYAYTKGPQTVFPDFFYSIKWAGENIKHMDINETASYLLNFNLVKIQARLKELGLKYYLYNSIGFNYKPTNPETILLQKQVDLSSYYEPENDMFSLVKSDEKYQLADGDLHPNHLAYEVWAKGFIEWLNGKQ